MKSFKKQALALTVVVFAAASASVSVTAADQSCKADVARLCGDVKPGQGRIANCLKAHQDEISPECKQWLATKGQEIKSKLEEVNKACSGDVEKLCKGVEPGQGRIPKCLWQNRAKLSPECKASMAK